MVATLTTPTTLERTYAPKLRVALLRSIAPTVALVEAGASPELAAAAVTSKPVAEVLVALYVAAGTRAARTQYEALTPPTKALAPVALVRSWADRLSAFIAGEGAATVRRITDTTRKLVRQALQESATLGEGAQAAATRLQQAVAGIARKRAVRIVRTELLAASSYGSLLGAEATGLKLEKVWLATQDGRTRPGHIAANGQAVALQGGMFIVDGFPARYPGDPMLPASERINCRCTLIYKKITPEITS